jgi:hypothetical protein
MPETGSASKIPAGVFLTLKFVRAAALLGACGLVGVKYKKKGFGFDPSSAVSIDAMDSAVIHSRLWLNVAAAALSMFSM